MAAANVCVPRVSHSHTHVRTHTHTLTHTHTHLSRRLSKTSQAGRSGPGTYQIIAFVLIPEHVRSVRVPFKNEVSISLSPGVLLKLSPAGLQSQKPWGVIWRLGSPI